jgi:predicted lipid carrier protein YhbT/chorismate mutase
MIRIESTPHMARLALHGARLGIDRVDDAMIVLLAARRRLVSAVAPIKRALDAPVRDALREEQVHDRARRLAARLRLPTASADNLMGALVTDACQQQSEDARPRLRDGAAPDRGDARRSLLRLLPPPRYWRLPLSLVPSGVRDSLAERVLSKAVTGSRADDFSLIAHRRLGIEVSDLGLGWVLELRDGRLHRSHEAAEAVVHGTATDLLLLSSRQEDADTLFFQRRLKLTGDVELGLTVRNLLDRLPWETLPLGVRIALHRSAGLLRAARAAHRASS